MLTSSAASLRLCKNSSTRSIWELIRFKNKKVKNKMGEKDKRRSFTFSILGENKVPPLKMRGFQLKNKIKRELVTTNQENISFFPSRKRTYQASMLNVVRPIGTRRVHDEFLVVTEREGFGSVVLPLKLHHFVLNFHIYNRQSNK